jgi:polyferredoxin
MKNWFILFGVILVLICFGVVAYNDMIPDISCTVLMHRTWLGMACGYTGITVIVINMLRRPNYFRRAQPTSW